MGTVAAADEIYLGRSPLLLTVGPLSLLIIGLRLAEECMAEAWEPVPGQMGDLEGYGADGGSALGKAGGDAKVPLHADMFHLLRPARTGLAKLMAETIGWRRVDKDPVAVLEGASNGSLADDVEIAIVKLVDRAVRSSSYVECVNSRVRLVQVARKRLSEDSICPLAVYRDLKPYGRGSVRAGKSPAELAGIGLATWDWIESLDLTAEGLAQAAEEAA